MSDLSRKNVFQEISRSIPDIIYMFTLTFSLYCNNWPTNEFSKFFSSFAFVMILFNYIDKKIYMSTNKESESGALDSRAIEAEQEVKDGK